MAWTSPHCTTLSLREQHLFLSLFLLYISLGPLFIIFCNLYVFLVNFLYVLSSDSCVIGTLLLQLPYSTSYKLSTLLEVVLLKKDWLTKQKYFFHGANETRNQNIMIMGKVNHSTHFIHSVFAVRRGPQKEQRGKACLLQPSFIYLLT